MYCCKHFKKTVNDDRIMGNETGNWIIPQRGERTLLFITYCPFCGKHLAEYQRPRDQ